MCARFAFFLFLCFVSDRVTYAQQPQYESLTIEQGLSQGMIFDILQTRNGFLWVATKDGLNRYDGYNFKIFTNTPFDPFSLAQNNVTCLFEDSRGLLWVGLDSKGLDVFDPKTGHFHHFPLDYKGEIIVHGTEVRRIVELPDGSILVLRLGTGIIRLTVPEGWENDLPAEPVLEKWVKPDVLKIETDLNAKPQPEAILDMNVLATGDLLATSTHRQFRVEPKTGAYSAVNTGMVPINTHWSVQGDEAFGGDLWVGQGIEIRRLRNGQVKSFIPSGPFCTLTLTKGQKGHVWLSLCNKLWDLAPGEDLDFSKPDLVLDGAITCLDQDKNGNLWLGTSGYGLRKINAVGKHFHTGGKGASVRGLWRSPSGRYFGKVFSTIRPYDPASGRFDNGSAFLRTPLDEFSLTFDPDSTTWLLCWENGTSKLPMLHHYAPDGSFVKSYQFEADNLCDLLLRRRDGSICFGMGHCFVVRFDPATERFERFSFAHLFGDKNSSVRIVALAEDEDGTLWLGTQLGLVKCTQNAQGFDFKLFEANPEGLNNNSIACALPTPDGQIWLGTKGGGINILNPETGRCRHITTANGLLNNVVYGILPGNRPGEFWCSTNRGLAKITVLKNDPFEFETTTFTAAVGLQDNEFNTNAYFKAGNGELLFGGVNGLNRFFPEELHFDTVAPPVYIIGLEINRKKADFGDPGSPLTAPLEIARRIELAYDQNNISFEFTALDLTDPSKNRYRYRLVGLENDWVEAGPSRFAHYSHLPPGSYELRVQGSNGESAWRDAMPITVVVNPPWYRSGWAYTFYLALLVWAGWRAYQFQIRRVKEREQLAFEHRETERVKALEQVKTDFFSNVTHEFRTPLTLMLEPLRRVLPQIKDPDVLENVQLAEANSRKLLGLVNQLLDMAKLESGQTTLDLRRADIAQTAREAFEQFLPLAEKRGVKLAFSAPKDLPPFEFDPNKVGLVLNNLISNALKFTPTGQQVEVNVGRVSSNPSDGVGESVEIRVRDTGIGIAPENVGKVFDRFYQVDGSNTRAGEGTGIGLALSKQLAELMGGGIRVESEVGKGSVFAFWIPASPPSAAPKRGESALLWASQLEGNVGRGTLGENARSNAISPAFGGAGGGEAVVLVIEDNAELRHFIKKAVAGAGWQVVEASDGEEGIKKAIELVPDLVVSDVMMPRKDGFAVVDALKNNELTAHIPIILLTAKSSIESKLKGLRRGADDYLIKPFSTEELLARMENLLEMRRHLRALFGGQNLPSAIASVGAGAAHTDLISEPDRTFLQKFTLLLEENLGNETISVEDFAQQMLLSRSQLHRKLRSLTDKSPTDFVRDYRLDRAYAMLRNREGRVGEVALRVGFGNEKYFSTVFREKFGVSPSQI